MKELNFEDFANHEFFKVEKDFVINLENESCVYFAPNGVGKTTLFKMISEKYPEKNFITYENWSHDNYEVVGDKKIIISPNLEKIRDLNKEKTELLNHFSFKKFAEETNIKKTPLDSKEMNEYFGSEKWFPIKIGETEFKKLDSENITDVNNYLSKRKQINVMAINSDQIESKNNEIIKNILGEYINYREINPDDDKCTICKNDINQRQFEEIIKIHEEIKTEKIKLGKSLIKSSDKEYDYIKVVDDAIKIHQNHTLDDSIEFLYLKNKKISIQEYQEQSKRFQEIESELKLLDIEKNKFYDYLKKQEKKIKEILENYYDSSVSFDDKSNFLEINLKRNADTFSTGEKNFLMILVGLFSFQSSESELLVIDDPLSSYDSANQFRIIYEIVKNVDKKNSKNIIIFSHNLNIINLLYYQRKDYFKYKWIHKVEDESLKNFIEISKIDSPGDLFHSENLIIGKSEDKDRDYLLAIKRRDPESDKTGIFHYNGEINQNKSGNLTNGFFIKKIEEFDKNFSFNKDFYKNTFEKILIQTSIRVWIEKKIFDLLLELGYNKEKIEEKLDLIGEKGKQNYPSLYSRITSFFKIINEVSLKYKNLDEKKLISFKVMMNINFHSKNQITPFEFCTSITDSEFKRNILEIKKMFTKTE